MLLVVGTARIADRDWPENENPPLKAESTAASDIGEYEACVADYFSWPGRIRLSDSFTVAMYFFPAAVYG